jgi:H+-transporting ATPase
MIILLALLNDLPILAIAYDNTRVNTRPVRWNMAEMLTVSTVLGVTGVIGSFLLFFILREKGFPEEMIQSMMFLKLIVAGHSTLYITRTEDWFWRRPWPAPLLFSATFGTEILGTLIAVYGILMTPIGWEYALWMWAYALAWFFIDNVARMLAWRLLHARK